MKLLTKFKKLTLFIMKQQRKILETVLPQYSYYDKKSYNNGNFDLIFNVFTINRNAYSY